MLTRVSVFLFVVVCCFRVNEREFDIVIKSEFDSKYFNTQIYSEEFLSSGGSKFHRRGEGECQLPRWGLKPVIWLNFFRKLHENERIRTGGGGESLVPTLDPPIISWDVVSGTRHLVQS